MSSRRSVRQVLVAVLLGVLVGGGLMAVTPAGAEVSSAVATNWKKIWKKNLKPLADKRYYTKKQSDAKYQPKGSYETAGSGYTKAESDAKYAGAGSSYTKAETDAKYAPAQPLYRGVFMIGGNAPAANSHFTNGFSFGATFAAAPTKHYIKSGDPAIADCPGTAANPQAAPGHLCVYEGAVIGSWGANRGICGATGCGPVNPFGFAVYGYTSAAGSAEIFGSWAARPGSPVANPARPDAGQRTGVGSRG